MTAVLVGSGGWFDDCEGIGDTNRPKVRGELFIFLFLPTTVSRSILFSQDSARRTGSPFSYFDAATAPPKPLSLHKSFIEVERYR